ncbi:MAG TPA: hypothetical protein PLD73_03495 [Candidatus Hydrogenedentes bacterium]|nr:hypothetical protein [Candidatus Hydrogenedentota bacterium]
MMFKNGYYSWLIAAMACVLTIHAEAAVPVNGVSGEDDDGMPPFESVQQAVIYAIDNGENEVTLDANDISGWSFRLLNNEAQLNPQWPDGTFTIRAGDGFSPVVTGGNNYLCPHDFPNTTIVLEGFTIDSTTFGLITSGNVTLRDMEIVVTSGGGHACLLSNVNGTNIHFQPGTKLTVENTVLRRVNAAGSIMVGGHGHQSYEFRNCQFISDSSGPSVLTFAGDETVGTAEDVDLTVVGCTFDVATGALNYSAADSSTAGLEFVNNVVLSAGEHSTAAPVVALGNNHAASRIVHSTFRVQGTANVTSLVNLAATMTTTPINLSNSLFDAPIAGIAGVSVGDAGQAGALTGDANAYNMETDHAYQVAGADQGNGFEAANRYLQNATNGVYISDVNGRITADATLVVGRAVAVTPAVTTDIDGESRPQGPASDIGADEVAEAGGGVTGAARWTTFE